MAQQIRDVMTPQSISVPESASVTEAARLMREHDIGDVVVSEDGGKVVGILTDRDIVIRAVAETPDLSQAKVGDVCSHDLHTVSPDDQVGEAVRVMREQAIRRLPVLEGGRMVGFVSIGDLAVEQDPRSALADISHAPPNT